MVTRETIDMKSGEEIPAHSGESPRDRLSLLRQRMGKVKAAPSTQPELAVKPELKVKPRIKPELLIEHTPQPPSRSIEWKDGKAFVKIVCLRPVRKLVVGRVSKNDYVFEHGKPVSVDLRDAGYMLDARRSSRSCCGGSGEPRVFIESHEV